MSEILASVAGVPAIIGLLGVVIGVYVLAAPASRGQRGAAGGARAGRLPSRLVRVGQRAEPRRRHPDPAVPGPAAEPGGGSSDPPPGPIVSTGTGGDDGGPDESAGPEGEESAVAPVGGGPDPSAEVPAGGAAATEAAALAVVAASPVPETVVPTAESAGEDDGFFSYSVARAAPGMPSVVQHWAESAGIRGDAHDPAVRRRFLRRLMLVDAAGDRSDLFARAYRDDAALRADILRAISEYGYRGGRPTLTTALRGEDMALRPMAARGAVCIRAEDLVDEALVSAHMPTVRAAAAELLRRDGLDAAWARIEGVAGSERREKLAAIFDLLRRA